MGLEENIWIFANDLDLGDSHMLTFNASIFSQSHVIFDVAS